ncbi:hypothetical protein EV363DRAFT_1394489 [Boletus edulis]|uniref:Uncharacterized protein n=1 Tax=Boletus edulis BED1 TaxID=1328754 RepID=A0AAD4GAX0_BOLED|nr:hypothetical protein EV363DRAFT_1394489 [Boletus edulis]KAF8432930.1 hypothetical protein L210DRAFT_433169 [Boletus edulis BED1]
MNQQQESTPSTSALKSGDSTTSTEATGKFAYLQPYARSKAPALALTSLFALSSLVPPAALPPHTYCPPYLQRVGFSLAFGVATWAFSAGDVRNGAGIATAWSLIYLTLHARKSLRAPRHPVPLALSAGATACAALYGTEHFVYQS